MLDKRMIRAPLGGGGGPRFHHAPFVSCWCKEMVLGNISASWRLMVRHFKCEAKNVISVVDNRESLKAVSRWGAMV